MLPEERQTLRQIPHQTQGIISCSYRVPADILDGAAWKATILHLKKHHERTAQDCSSAFCISLTGKEDALSAITRLITVLTKFAKLILLELLLPGKIISGE